MINRNRNSSKVIIVIKIKEGPRIFIGSLRIVSTFKKKPTNIQLSINVGDPFNIDKVQSISASIKDSIAANGYLKGEILPKVMIDSLAYKAFITFEIYSGPKIIVGDIEIKGLKSVNSEVVKRELEFKSGDVLTSKKISDTEHNLYRTGGFSFLTIEPVISDSVASLPPKDTVVPVKVTLTETKFITLEAGIGYSAYERLSLSFATVYNNMFHRLHSIGIQAGASGIAQRAELTYGMQYLFTLPIDFYLIAFYERRDDLLFNVPLPYSGAFNGFTVSIRQQRFQELSYNLQLQWENTLRVNTPIPDTVTGVSDKSTRSVIGNLTLDKRNNVINPTNGYINGLFMEIAGFGGGTNQFIKFENDLRGYFTIDSSVTLSCAATIGYANPYGSSNLMPVQDQFYAGGSRSVRGYDLDNLVLDSAGNPIGGNFKLVFHLLEVQFPLFWIVNAAVFSDAGYVWPDIQSVNLSDILYTAGPGIRFITPVGIIRFDVGFRLNGYERGGYRMYLDIGRAF